MLPARIAMGSVRAVGGRSQWEAYLRTCVLAYLHTSVLAYLRRAPDSETRLAYLHMDGLTWHACIWMAYLHMDCRRLKYHLVYRPGGCRGRIVEGLREPGGWLPSPNAGSTPAVE